MLDSIIEVLKTKNELVVAKTLIDTFAKYASNLMEFNTIAKAYCEIKKYPDSIKWAEKALVASKTNEEKYACRANIAKVSNHANDPEKALFHLGINKVSKPNDYEIALEQSFSLFLLGRNKESEVILREMATRNDIPADIMSRVKFNLGTYDLYNNEFQKGLYGFLIECKNLGIWKKQNLPFKFWEGGIQPGKTLIILAEGGIGDEIINIRFMDIIKSFDMTPIWYTTRQDLYSIFKRNGYNTITNLQDAPKDSLWTYGMSLPVYLDLMPKDLWKGQYLVPSEEYKEKFNWVKSDKIKVGIRWAGNIEYEHDLHRSVPLSKIYDLLKDRGYELYSLQKDDGIEQLKDFPEIKDMSAYLDSYEDTMAVMDHLDFIITSCTSVLHMAAAMDKKVYALVPTTAYYTWCSSNEYHSIWYSNNLTLFRQHSLKNWEDPINDLRKTLDLL